MITFNNVSFTYDSSDVPALQNISFHIKKGEFVLLLGESGCGKTTMTRLINALAPDFYEGEIAGDVIIDNMNTREHTIQELSRSVGSVFQDPRSQFFTTDSTAEIAFSCENAGLKREITVSRIIDAAEILKIKNLLGKSVFKLSNGEKQMIAIASVYAGKPEIMVFDEPSANLDNHSIERLKNNLETLKDRGHTIVISEHRIYYLRELCDRVFIIKNGKIEKILSGSEFKNLSNEHLNQAGLRGIHQEKPVRKKSNHKSTDPVLKLQDISFGYKRNNNLLSNLNINVHKGEILGITAKNGTGKTTLLEIICGIKKQKSGTIYINDKKTNPKDRIKRTYFVMQDSDYQLLTESVKKEIYLGSKKEKGHEERGLYVLNQMNLTDYLDRHPASLSGGQKQRLCIAVSYMKNVDIICFDEPTSGLDYKSMKSVAALLRILAKSGKAIIITTHDLEFLTFCCSSVYELKS